MRGKKGKHEGRNRPSKKQDSPPQKQRRKNDLVADFIGLRKRLYNSSLYYPDTEYKFFVASCAWIEKWKKNGQVPDTQLNSDLLHRNPHCLPVDVRVPGLSLPLKNDLDLDVEYEILTDEAWALLASIAPSLEIQRSAVWDGENFSLYRIFTLNVITLVRDAEHPEGDSSFNITLVSSQCTSGSANFFSQLASEMKIEGEFEVFLIEGQRTIDQVRQLLAARKIRGRKITDFRPSSIDLNYLKETDIFLVCASGSDISVEDRPFEDAEGVCHGCDKSAELKYHCVCHMASYCCFDCKAEDYIRHRRVCGSKYEDLNEDIGREDKGLKGATNDGLAGIINVGNFCYANVLIQILRFEHKVRESMFLWRENNKAAGIWHTFRKLWTASGAIQPWGFKLSLGLAATQFLGYAQQDAHEAFITLLNLLEEADP